MKKEGMRANTNRNEIINSTGFTLAETPYNVFSAPPQLNAMEN